MQVAAMPTKFRSSRYIAIFKKTVDYLECLVVAELVMKQELMEVFVL